MRRATKGLRAGDTYTHMCVWWGRRPQRHTEGGGPVLKAAIGSRRRLPPQAPRYIQGSSPSASEATLGSVPCACVLVSPLYYKASEYNCCFLLFSIRNPFSDLPGEMLIYSRDTKLSTIPSFPLQAATDAHGADTHTA